MLVGDRASPWMTSGNLLSKSIDHSYLENSPGRIDAPVLMYLASFASDSEPLISEANQMRGQLEAKSEQLYFLNGVSLAFNLPSILKKADDSYDSSATLCGRAGPSSLEECSISYSLGYNFQ